MRWLSHTATLCGAIAVCAMWTCGVQEVGAAVRRREVAFDSEGLRLAGTLSLPKRRGPFPAILLIPGSGPVDRDGRSPDDPAMLPVYAMWATRLAGAGFAMLRYDKRVVTHGRRIDVSALDQEDQIADAIAALGALRSAKGVDPQRLVIMGHSEGGTLAPLVAGRAAPVAGVIAINTVAFPVDELIVAQLEASPTTPSGLVDEARVLFASIERGSFPSGGLLLGAGAAYWKQWIDFSRASLDTLAGLRTRALLVQCLADDRFPGATLGRNLAILRAATNSSAVVELRELAGLDHFGMATGRRKPSPAFVKALRRWTKHAVTGPGLGSGEVATRPLAGRPARHGP